MFGKFDRRLILNFEWPLFLIAIALGGIGLYVLASAGYNRDSHESLAMKRHAVFMAVGLGGFLTCVLIRGSFWRSASLSFYVIGVLLLVLTMYGGVVAGGARRWLDFGGVRLQPSELMKVSLILILARVFAADTNEREHYGLPDILVPLGLIAIPSAIILLQPDLGTAMTLVLIGGSMLVLYGVKLKTFLFLLISAFALAIPAWTSLKDYQRQRIMTFMSPELDPQGTGYHAKQSKIAVGSGKVLGKGYLQGTQSQLRFLPEQTTDFIFSVLAEEWGFAGAGLVLSLYAMIIFRLLQLASRFSEPFPAFVSCGVAALIFWHVFINIGMVIGILPVVGITLPLLSYGGSSVVTIMAALGIVAGLRARRFVFSS